MTRVSTLFVLAALGCVIEAGPAMAHAHLQQAVPADKARLASSPTSLTLTFTEGLNLAFSGIDVTDASGTIAQLKKPALEGADGTVLTVPLTSVLAPGRYTVTWHVLSRDGHKTQGSYSFAVQP